MTPNLIAGMHDSCLFFLLSIVYDFARCSPNVSKRSIASSSSQFLISFVGSSMSLFIKIEFGLFTDFGNKIMYSDILKIYIKYFYY